MRNSLIKGLTTMPGKQETEIIATGEAAKELGITVQRLRVLIREGRLPAQKLGRDWIIRKSDLELVRIRKPGRPIGKKQPKTTG